MSEPRRYAGYVSDGQCFGRGSIATALRYLGGMLFGVHCCRIHPRTSGVQLSHKRLTNFVGFDAFDFLVEDLIPS